MTNMLSLRSLLWEVCSSRMSYSQFFELTGLTVLEGAEMLLEVE